MKKRYEVLASKDEWVKAKKAVPVKDGWLHFELRDGTIGLQRPGKWRLVEVGGKE